MTPDQHGFEKCPSCGVWFRGEQHLPDTAECWKWKRDRVVIEVRAAHPMAFHLPECAGDTEDCDCSERQWAALTKERK